MVVCSKQGDSIMVVCSEQGDSIMVVCTVANEERALWDEKRE